MKHTRTETVPAHTREVTTHHTCDICGERCEPASCFDTDSVTIQYREGVNYPEFMREDVTECDLCGECFKTKLRDWLEEQGVSMRTTERER